jgi:chromate transporter
MIDPFIYLWLLLKASLVTTSGTGNIPILYQDLIPRGWATDRQFAEALAIGKISPGPSGLWVISLGYLTDGMRGALLALVAITIPPLVVVALDGLYHRIGKHPAVAGFVRGLSLAVIGIFVVVMGQLLHGIGLNTTSLLIAATCFLLGLVPRVPVVALLGIAAVLGIVLR